MARYLRSSCVLNGARTIKVRLAVAMMPFALSSMLLLVLFVPIAGCSGSYCHFNCDGRPLQSQQAGSQPGGTALSAIELRDQLEDAVAEVKRITGVQIEVVTEVDDLPNRLATASFRDGRARITFDLGYLDDWSRDPDGELFWNVRAIVAHEFGHLLYGHTIFSTISRQDEREADAFAGETLARLGATLPQASRAFEAIACEHARGVHPAKAERLAIVRDGWRRADDQANSFRRLLTYSEHVQAASQRIQDRQYEAARSHLIDALPEMGEPDLRDLVWRHLWALLHDYSFRGSLRPPDFANLRGTVSHVEFAPDGTMVTTWGVVDDPAQSRTSQIYWSEARLTHHHRLQFDTLTKSPESGPTCSVLDPGRDGRWIVTGAHEGDASVRFRFVDFSGRIEADRRVAVDFGFLAQYAELSGRSRYIVVAAPNAMCWFDPTTDDVQVFELDPFRHPGPVHLAVAVDAPLAVTAHYDVDGVSPRYILYQHVLGSGGESLEIPHLEFSWINQMVLSADGRILAIASDDSVSVFHRSTADPKDTLWHAVKYYPTVHGSNLEPEAFHATRVSLSAKPSSTAAPYPARAMHVSGDGSEIVAAGADGVAIFRVRWDVPKWGSPGPYLTQDFHFKSAPEFPESVGFLDTNLGRLLLVVGATGETFGWQEPFEPARRLVSEPAIRVDSTLLSDDEGVWASIDFDGEDDTYILNAFVRQDQNGKVLAIHLPEEEWYPEGIGDSGEVLWFVSRTNALRAPVVCFSRDGKASPVASVPGWVEGSSIFKWPSVTPAARTSVAVIDSINVVSLVDASGDSVSFRWVREPSDDNASNYGERVAISPDGRLIAYLGVDGVRDATTRIIVRDAEGLLHFQTQSRYRRVNHLKFSQTGRWLAFQESGQAVHIVDLSGQVGALSFKLPGQRSGGRGVLAFSEREDLVFAAARSSDPLHVWRLPDGAGLGTIPAISPAGSGLVLLKHSDDRAVIGSQYARYVAQWSVATDRAVLHELQRRWEDQPTDPDRAIQFLHGLWAPGAVSDQLEAIEITNHVIHHSDLEQSRPVEAGLWIDFAQNGRIEHQR